jgi:hypothetical protein
VLVRGGVAPIIESPGGLLIGAMSNTVLVLRVWWAPSVLRWSGSRSRSKRKQSHLITRCGYSLLPIG